MSYSTNFLEGVKQRFGLVPMKGEPIRDFEKRVYETVHKKQAPGAGLAGKLLFMTCKTDRYGRRDVTKEVQDILDRYVGIREIPIDAFEVDEITTAKGCTLEEPDGSAVVVSKDMKDNTEELVQMFSDGLENLLLGKNVRLSLKEPKSEWLYFRAGFLDGSSVHNLYCSIFDGFLRNETFIKLHEGVHATHINNHKYGTRKRGLKDSRMIDATMAAIPILGPVLKAKRFGFAVDTEAWAYKVGLDEYMPELFGKAERLLLRGCKSSKQELIGLRQQIIGLNSHTAKTIIKQSYLNTSMKGYGFAKGDYAKAAVEAVYGALLLGIPISLGHAAGYTMILYGAHNLVKIPFSLYFQKKIDRTVDSIDRLAAHYGGTGKAFYETLGMTVSEAAKKMN